MGEHVHIRLKEDMHISENGELVESYRCQCGMSWTRTYPAKEAEPD